MFLKGKNILFFSASLFCYQDEIRKGLCRAGASVDYYDERPANTFLVKALIRINRNLLAGYVDRYYNRIIKQTCKKNYDYIFFTKGESVSVKNICKLKQLHPQAIFMIYHWDSIANNHNAQRLLPCFDRIFSFDKVDCKNLKLRFLPLFYIPDYGDIPKSKSEIKYDVLFVGTTHSDRYQFVKKVEKQVAELGGKCFTWFYFPSKILYYKMKLQNKYLRNIPACKFHFKSMDKTVLLELCAQSKIIIDIQHPKQTGLTMRCIETLGAKRKLITTNQAILEYDFYDENNILIVNREAPEIPIEFFSKPYQEISSEIYEKYSLDNWIYTIFSNP